MTICGWAEEISEMSSSIMDEDISVPTEEVARDLSPAEIERVLETLIVLAHNQQRNFLVYLLVMGLDASPRRRSGLYWRDPLKQRWRLYSLSAVLMSRICLL